MRATDPGSDDARAAVFPDLNYNSDPYQIARGGDALLILPNGINTGAWMETIHAKWRDL